jgi:hypothetical protein
MFHFEPEKKCFESTGFSVIRENFPIGTTFLDGEPLSIKDVDVLVGIAGLLFKMGYLDIERLISLSKMCSSKKELIDFLEKALSFAQACEDSQEYYPAEITEINNTVKTNLGLVDIDLLVRNRYEEIENLNSKSEKA